MSRGFFGEYLIEKKLISTEVLVKALLEQLKSLKSSAAILFEHKNLNSAEILKIFKAQHQKNLNFEQAAKECSLWKDDFSKLIEREMLTSKTPLGEILIHMGAIDLPALTKYLDEFWSIPETSPTQPAPLVSTEVIPFEAQEIEALKLMDFRDFFDEGKYQTCLKAIDLLEKSKGTDKAQAMAVNSYKLFQGMVGFFSLNQFKGLTFVFSKLSLHFQSHLESLDQIQIPHVKAILEMTWQWRESIMDVCKESVYIQKVENQKSLSQHLQKMEG